MKTLFIVNGAPYPPRGGSPLRAWQIINLFATDGPVHVRSFGLNEGNETEMPVAESWVHVGDVPAARAAIIERLARFLIAREYPLDDLLRKFSLNRELERTISLVAPDLIVLSNWHHDIPKPLRKRRFVLDAHNIESTLAAAIWSKANAGRLSLVQRSLLRRWRRRERALFRAASLVLLPSHADVAELARFEPRVRQKIVWPNAVDVDAYEDIAAVERPAHPPTLIYVGSFAYPPNAVAAMRLICDIFPAMVRRAPDTRLVLVGIHPTLEMRDAAGDNPAITITGGVSDVRPWLAQGNVAMMPISEGGGTRLKILESFAAGIPVVSTRKGIEGVEAFPGVHYLHAETTREFVDAYVRLESDEGLRRAIIRQALEFVADRYSWRALVPRLAEIIA